MNYEVRAIFYRGDEPMGDDQGFTVAKFEAESIEAARALAEASVEEAIRFHFSKVFRVYRLPSRELACEIVRPAAYEVDGLYDDGHGSQEHQIFDAFDAKDDAEARHKLHERSGGGLAAGYRGNWRRGAVVPCAVSSRDSKAICRSGARISRQHRYYREGRAGGLALAGELDAVAFAFVRERQDDKFLHGHAKNLPRARGRGAGKAPG